MRTDEVLVAIGVVLATALATVAQRAEARRVGYRVGEMERIVEKLDARRRNLDVLVQHRRSAPYLLDAAEGLGMNLAPPVVAGKVQR